MKRALLAAIDFYQLAMSPHSPPACRFVPSCSHYAHDSIEKYGALKGSWLAMKRLIRCHPFNSGGLDPVP